MDSNILFHLLLLLFASTFTHFLYAIAEPAVNPISSITVVGVVFCDICSSNTFSRHSYFLPGVDVNIKCIFKANSPKTSEQMSVSLNRTTDRYGVYKLEIPHVDGVDCVEGLAIESVCRASLIGTPTTTCDIPALKTSTNQISVKSKQENLCIYSLNALSFKPSKKNATLCGNHNEKLPNSFETSKCFFPFFGFPWPFNSFPFPPISSIFNPPPPTAFNLGDPRTWIPSFPPSPPRT